MHSLLYLVAEMLGGDAEDVQAQRGLLQLGLQGLQLQRLLLAALPQLLDQSSVQLLGPLGPSCRVRCSRPAPSYTNTQQHENSERRMKNL